MKYNAITLTIREGVAVMTLNRPEKLNAMNPTLLEESAGVLKTLNENDKVKVLILTGSGRGFCSGADLSGPVSGIDMNQPGLGRREKLEPFVRFGVLIRELERFAKPTIAAVNGIAAGGGLALALACDIRIAAEEARFSAIFVKRGLVPDCGTTFYLPRVIGTGRALELMWTGDVIDARDAERIGLVNRVVPGKILLVEAKKLAFRLAESPSVSIELTKKLVYEGLKASSALAQLMSEDYAQYVCRQTEDVREGKASFLEKRPPRFKGR